MKKASGESRYNSWDSKAKYMQDSCNHIEIEAIPAFSYLTNRTIDVPDIGEVKVDSFWWKFFASLTIRNYP